MERAQHDLGLLVRLQQVYTQIGAALEERNTAPPEVLELMKQNARRQEELEELEQQVKKLNEELLEVRKKEGESQLELDHFQAQKTAVTNEREFTAVISEIDFATNALSEASGRRKELEGACAGLGEDIERRRQARPEEEEAQRAVVANWDKRKGKLKRKIHKLSVEAKKIEAKLQPKNRARFLRLLESKRGVAVAAVVEDSCSLCHFALRPHLQQRVRRGEEIISCEHCRRILFLPEVEQPAVI